VLFLEVGVKVAEKADDDDGHENCDDSGSCGRVHRNVHVVARRGDDARPRRQKSQQHPRRNHRSRQAVHACSRTIQKFVRTFKEKKKTDQDG